LETPAAVLKKSDDDAKKKKSKEIKYSPFELLPRVIEGYEEYEQAEYHYKMLCHIASSQNSLETKRLYEEATLFDVYEIIILNRALSWS
jgi:hypothetical protein